MAGSNVVSMSNLSGNSVYTLTREAHDRYQRGEADRKDIELLNEWNSADRKFKAMLEKRGVRYRDCTFSNYECEHRGQREIVEKLQDYAASIEENLRAGRNIVFFGPKGTGKDHLIIATAKACMMQARAVTHWINGPDLLAKFRHEAMSGSEWTRSCEEKATILAVSDILPPTGALSESQKHYLFKLIDDRYSHMRPTWLTLNVASGEEAEERLGPQVVDRLRHDALTLFCNWPSYRSKENKPCNFK